MAKRHTFLIALGLISAIGAGSAFAQTDADMNSNLDSLFDSHAPYQAFFAKLKKAVSTDDKATVAAMVDYPFQAHIKGKAQKIKDAGQFTAAYDQIVTDKIKAAVAKQTYAKLFANAQGVMIGNGEVWFSGVCSDNSCKQQTVKVTAINN